MNWMDFNEANKFILPSKLWVDIPIYDNTMRTNLTTLAIEYEEV